MKVILTSLLAIFILSGCCCSSRVAYAVPVAPAIYAAPVVYSTPVTYATPAYYGGCYASYCR